MSELKKTLDVLGIKRSDSLFYTSEDIWKRECPFPERIKKVIDEKIKPDAFFCFSNKPLVLFFENLQNMEVIHKAIWNFNESPIVIVINKDEIRIFNGFKYCDRSKSLELLGNSELLNDFEYFQIVTGRTWEKYQEELKLTNRVDYNLLNNIKGAREILINKCELETTIANALIGKIIFTRYLIDRKVKIGYKGLNKYWTNQDLIDLLRNKTNTINFFQYMENKFNGDMFTLNEHEYNSISVDCLEIIIKLLNEEEMSSGQKSLFKLYDFSIIPIEFISNVYESFIGENNQEKEGAYYTPLFLVDYILNKTIGEYFLNNSTNYNCKVLDPACGSGVFLVETLRKIIEQCLKINPDIRNQTEAFKKMLTKLAKDNIYGVDKNLSAIQVAIFSIHLTLLDYQIPSSIENFKFPRLLNTNFFQSDFFDTKHIFNNIFAKKVFEFVLGNPPWKRGKSEKKPLFLNYIKERKKREKNITKCQISISNNEIAQAFLLRISDFQIRHEASLIVTSKVLYNTHGIDFRKYFLNNFKVKQVFELAPVRHEVFDKSNDPSIAPATVIFYKYSCDTNKANSSFEHISLKPSIFFSMFKIFSFNKTDIKKINQEILQKYDWLWKVLVYGSYLDFNLILRLKNEYPTLDSEVSNKKKYITGQGIMVGGGDKNDASHLMNLPYINTRKKDVRPFWVNPKISEKWSHSSVHRTRNKELFKAPMLLITEGLTKEFKSVSAVCLKNAVFRSSLTAVKAHEKKDKNSLKMMSALLNSDFFAYFALQTFSSVGVEREQSHDNEKWTLPYSYKKEFINKIENIENLKQKYFSSSNLLKKDLLKLQIEKETGFLNKQINGLFDLSSTEISLLDYANNIVIPIAKRHPGHEKLLNICKFKDTFLEKYARIFLNRFDYNIDDNKKFIAEIWYTKHIIGMFFKVITTPLKTSEKEIHWVDKSNENIFNKIIKICSKKVTAKLFLQKDIRGFDQNYFYVFKPNEKRLWHEAIGHIDANEFMDAILKSGRGI